MARLAFVVLAHRNPRQLGNLVAALGPERTLLHVDAACDRVTCQAMRAMAQGADLLPQARSAWASWGIVEAALSGFRRALQDADLSHVGVLSGQDYPLVPVPYMESLLEDGVSFTRVTKLPLPWMASGGGFDRVHHWNWPVRGRRLRIPGRRALPSGLVAHAGSLWSIYARRHLESVLEHADAHGDWWRRVWIPDELFIPSVLGTEHKDHLLQANPGYTEWVRGCAHPKTFTLGDISRVAMVADREISVPPGRKWFARKFDDETGHAVAALKTALADIPLSGRPLERSDIEFSSGETT